MYIYEKIRYEQYANLPFRKLLSPLEELRASLRINKEDVIKEYLLAICETIPKTMSKEEAEQFVETELTIDGRLLKDHVRLRNISDALKDLEDFISLDPEVSYVDPQLLKKIHKIVTKNELNSMECGEFRTDKACFLTSNYEPPSEYDVPEAIDDLCWHFNATRGYIPDIVRICEFKRNFERIQPFSDGNGRTGRLIMNALLIQYGYGYFVPAKEEKMDYLNSLDKNEFHEFAVPRIIKSMEKIAELEKEDLELC